MKRAWPVLALLLLAACGAPVQPESDWELANQGRLAESSEAPVPLPPYPKKENLVEFYVSATADFKYFVDASTLTVAAKQRIIRYVLVARSPSGVDNVSYEAMRCPDEFRVLAVGEGEGKWRERPQGGEWRAITKGAALSRQYALARNYFCPHRDPIQTALEGADALRRGSHPAVYVDPRGLGGMD